MCCQNGVKWCVREERGALERRRIHSRIFSKVKKQITGEQSYYISFIEIQSAPKLCFQL